MCSHNRSATSKGHQATFDKEAMDEIFEEGPTLTELCEHIRIGSKWHQLGIQLELDPKKLDDIQTSSEDSTYKTTKMFELWLDTNPHGIRRQVLDALRKDVIEEFTIAHKYETFCKTGE